MWRNWLLTIVVVGVFGFYGYSVLSNASKSSPGVIQEGSSLLLPEGETLVVRYFDGKSSYKITQSGGVVSFDPGLWYPVKKFTVRGVGEEVEVDPNFLTDPFKMWLNEDGSVTIICPGGFKYSPAEE